MKLRFKVPAYLILMMFGAITTNELCAQNTAKTRGKTTPSAAELAKKLANPISSLISVPLQSNLDLGIGNYNGSKMVINLQPVVPISISKNWNLITRWIVPIVSQHDINAEKTSEAGLGDAVISGFFSPKNTGITWGVGPVFLVPTATDELLGTQKIGVGPSAVLLKQSNGWTVGGLINHLWSVAGKETRQNVSSTFVNPFFAYNWKSGAGITMNLEYTYDWENETNVFVCNFPYFTAVTKFGSQTVSFGIGPRLHFAPETHPDYGVRAQLTLVFPK